MASDRLGLLLLHALPLDGSMWAGQMHLLPGSTYAPTLYSLGDNIEAWAAGALKLARGNRLIVVGCSVGASCALEIAGLAAERIAALVLIGTKARHRPEPAFHVSALELLREQGLEAAWETYWAPLFSGSAARQVIDAARTITLPVTAGRCAWRDGIPYATEQRASLIELDHTDHRHNWRR